MNVDEGAEMNDAQKVTEALRAHPPTETDHGPLYCHPCSAAIGDWVQWTPEHAATAVLAALDLSVRDARVRAEALRESAVEIEASRSLLGVASRALDPGRAYAAALLRDRAAAERGSHE